MRVGSLDAPKIATEAGARSADSGCGAVIIEAIAAEGMGEAAASFGETRARASLGLAMASMPEPGTVLARPNYLNQDLGAVWLSAPQYGDCSATMPNDEKQARPTAKCRCVQPSACLTR